MSDADQSEPKAGQSESGCKMTPQSSETGKEDIYGFRAEMDLSQEAPEEQPQKAKAARPATLLLAVAALACVALVVLAIPSIFKPKPPVQYIDLGNRRFDPAGLAGRLIVRWEGSAAYQLSLDPLDQGETGGFQAVAANPPHPLAVTIRLKNAAGIVLCQKEILLPDPLPSTPTDRAPALQPRKSPGGDTVQNVAGADGQIAEVGVEGPLPCPQKSYERLVAWEFSTNFPTLGGQGDWLRHEGGLKAKSRSAGAGSALQAQRLSGPIEGDDTIVADNPLRGTVETGAGRTFLIVMSGWRRRAPGWQIFPAAIHFRCDKNASCTLSRSNTSTTLQARLLK